MNIEPTEAMKEGLWHFTSRDVAVSVDIEGRIRRSTRSGGLRDCYCRHLEAVAIFDLKHLQNPLYDADALNAQLQNCRGTITGLSEWAFGLKLSSCIEASLLGPHLPGDTMPRAQIDSDGCTYIPLFIPYFERWHMGDIAADMIDGVAVWAVPAPIKPLCGRYRPWEYVGSFVTLYGAIQATAAGNKIP